MSSLIGRFQRDVPFLQQDKIPQEESGLEVTKLQYEGEEHEKLTDQDVANLAEALMNNTTFQGNLDLSNNDLSDQAALELARIFEKRNASNITQLYLANNNFGSKAGEYIGEALSANPDYKIFKLSFEKISLEQIGLVRIIEAVNLNENILKLNVGVVTDAGLLNLAELLKPNNSLEEITITETSDHQKYWSSASKKAFATMMKKHTQLRRVKFSFARDDQKEDKEFDDEIEFYTTNKS